MLKPATLSALVLVALATVPMFTFGETAFAATAAQNLQSFKDTKAAMLTKITAFVADVQACNPPVPSATGKIVDGFAGTQKDSATSQLNRLESSVVGHAAASESALGLVDKDLGICTSKASILDEANKAGTAAKVAFDEDVADLKTGMDVASKSKPNILTMLKMRGVFTAAHAPGLSLFPGDDAKCQTALAEAPGLEQAYADVAKSLADLEGSYASKSTFQIVAINAPNACQGHPSGLFQGISFQQGAGEEIQAIPVNTERGSDANDQTALQAI